jgi:hypothetical protein
MVEVSPQISKRINKLRETVNYNVSTILTLFEQYGFDAKNYKTSETIENHMNMCIKLDYNWVKYYKYKIASFYSYWEGQELPTQPKEIAEDKVWVLLGGKAMKWFESLTRKDEAKSKSLLTSILLCKRGLQRPDKQFLKDTEIKAFQKLTTKPENPYQKNQPLIDWADENKQTENISNLVSEIYFKTELKRTIKEVFDGHKYSDEDRFTPFFPSTNANYNNTRTEAGTVGHIMEELKDVMKDLFTSEELVNLRQIGELGHSRSQLVGIDDSRLLEKFAEMYKRILELAIDEEPKAVLITLSEALKARVISKGPPCKYFVMKSLQKFLWKTLKNHESNVFKLIGQPVDSNYLEQQIGILKDNEKYASIDYSDATNELHSWVTEFMFNEVSDIIGLTNLERQVGIDSLVNHTVERHNKLGEVISSAKQQNGQLMGSILSFPFLCLANATILRWSREISCMRSLSLKYASIAVNGDDGILRLNLKGLNAWKKLGPFIGLLPSVGKVYYSEKFLNINSTRFEPYNEVGEKFKFIMTPFINLGLAFGMKRSTKGCLEKAQIKKIGDDDSLGSICQELVRLAPEYCKESVLKLFINKNHDKLTSTKLPWFLPEVLGGLGLPPQGRFQPSKEDLRLATVIKNHHISALSSYKLKDWEIWKYAKDRVGKLPSLASIQQEFTVSTSSGMGRLVNENTLLSLFAVEAIFRSNLKDIFPQAKSISEVKGKTHNPLRNVEQFVSKVKKSPEFSDHRIINLTVEQAWNYKPKIENQRQFLLLNSFHPYHKIMSEDPWTENLIDDNILWL